MRATFHHIAHFLSIFDIAQVEYIIFYPSALFLKHRETGISISFFLKILLFRTFCIGVPLKYYQYVYYTASQPLAAFQLKIIYFVFILAGSLSTAVIIHCWETVFQQPYTTEILFEKNIGLLQIHTTQHCLRLLSISVVCFCRNGCIFINALF